jgi:branched-chain amino acid transport system substrate-binding protein
VVVIADADDSARLVKNLREQGYHSAIFAGPAAGRQRFVDLAGEAAEGVVFPQLLAPTSTASARRSTLASDRPEKHSSRPAETDVALDYATALAGDAVRLLVKSIRQAGLNRARIRDELAGISSWKGDAGDVRWDNLGRNTREVTLGTITRTADGPVAHGP